MNFEFEPVLNYTCNLPTASGELCGLCFKDHRALACHMRLSNAAGHGTRRIESFVTVANCCVICKAVHKIRNISIQHLTIALQTGRCTVGAARSRYQLVEPVELFCPVCRLLVDDDLEHSNEHVFEDFEQLRVHLQTHLPISCDHVVYDRTLHDVSAAYLGDCCSR